MGDFSGDLAGILKDFPVGRGNEAIEAGFPLKVAAPLVPVVVNVAILFEYAVFQFVSSVVVGITYPLVKLNTPVVLV